MKSSDIPQLRQHNQHITGTGFKDPVEVVRWLGAVQAQDYTAAKWAVGLRCQKTTDAIFEEAFSRGDILRTHVLRPTWHFVTPEDIRWMLALTAPRIRRAMSTYYRQMELDAAQLRRSNSALSKALQGGNQLTRSELRTVLQRSGIKTDGLRFSFFIMHAELEQLICSGPRRGKQPTYALLDERAPGIKTLERNEALARLARRYLTSRGPATLKDYQWWSGLTPADAKAGLEMIKSKLKTEIVDGQTYWLADSTRRVKDDPHIAYLLPNYDEYIVGYTDRSAIFDTVHTDKLDERANPLFQHTIVVDGRIVGTWKRDYKKDSVVISLRLFHPLSKAEHGAISAATKRYSAFHGLPVKQA
jgi:hypothetical protein